MIVSEFIPQVFYAYRGKTASRVPTAGSEKYNLYLAIANRKKTEWATDPNNRWASLFSSTTPNEPGTVATSGTTTLTGTGTNFTDYAVGDKITVDGETVRTIATISSDTSLTVTSAFSNTASGKTFTHTMIVAGSTYKLHRRFYLPSDYLRIDRTDTSYVEYPIVLPQRRNISTNQSAYISGYNPKVLTLATDIDTLDTGGTLTLPGYYTPADMADATDFVPVDDPNWLVYITASELARNDPAKEDQYASLLAMANDLYRKMVDANNGGTFLQPNGVAYNMPIIGGSTGDW